MDRSLKYILLTLTLSLLFCSESQADTVEKALAMRPVQKDVSYGQVAADDTAKCTLSNVKIKGWRGFELVGPDGAILRRFADTNDDKKIDLWSYFQYGMEVYRDIDADFDGKADQYRWLSTGGTRWGLDDNEDGQIDRWKQISAEEVSAEVVAAIRDQNIERFVALLISENEIKELGLSEQKSGADFSQSRSSRTRLCRVGKAAKGDRSQLKLGPVRCHFPWLGSQWHRWIDQRCRRLRECCGDVPGRR